MNKIVSELYKVRKKHNMSINYCWKCTKIEYGSENDCLKYHQNLCTEAHRLHSFIICTPLQFFFFSIRIQ